MPRPILLAIILSMFALNLMGQDQEVQSKGEPKELLVGLIFAPFAATIFEGNPPFSTGVSLFFATAVVKGDWSFAPYYSFASNGAGAFVTYNISDKIGTYVAADKTLGLNTGNYAFGLTTPIGADYIQAYVEIGRTYGDDSTAFFGVGLYFNLFKSVTSW